MAGIFKNESPFVLEWTAYHKVIGFDHFIIADNGSDDGTGELLAALATLGVVTLLHFPTRTKRKPQLPAYSRILHSCPSCVDVLAFVDADEFILPLDGSDSIVPLAERLFASDEVSAVALNWASFGSSGYLFAEDGLVIERFTRRAEQAFGVNHHYKSLVRPHRVAAFDNPHHGRLRWGRYVDALGRDLVLHPKHGGGLSAEVVWAGARVNHYAVKSLEEFVLGKSRTGSASKPGRVKHKAYFMRHDRNEESCLLAKALAPKVREEMARLEALVQPLLAKRCRKRGRSLLHRLRFWG